ncbi:bifunctional phosphoribosylaminoimidazolecarboxamide formyltransferase/IMP cyclohydrolase [bacterium]|nr:bifunctional phosphoribosylaminoimidazolecarboxamide formyltransferase/IMP cyclohydrolase [candidate division CSSED10-310 bacterium]
MTKKRALISVSDKTGIIDFSQELLSMGYEIVSTGGTAQYLWDSGIRVTAVSDITGFPEILNGRVKTLHPVIHAGILADQNNPRHMETLVKHNILPFQIVVINLYPFEETVRKNPKDLNAAIENIDIGGPTLIRAAAKNHNNIAVVTDPLDYVNLVDELKRNDGSICSELRLHLACKAFNLTAQYDAWIASYFEGKKPITSNDPIPKCLPESFHILLSKKSHLRYGENPHQKAAIYQVPFCSSSSVTESIQISGKELSYNNFLDLHAAWNAVLDFDVPAAVIIKHQNPCGAAVADKLADAYRYALECDPISAYGGIVALNSTVDFEVAQMLHKTKFIEVIAAPDYTSDAIELMIQKKNRRIMKAPLRQSQRADVEAHIFNGSAFVQETDQFMDDSNHFTVVTDTKPSKDEMEDLLFAWRICKFVKSNAIVFAKNKATVGIGAGQVSRIDSVKIAAMKAQDRAQNAVMASDAFFPFRDGIDEAKKAGIKAVIQPGGSKRDNDAIQACNEFEISMIFTGCRHFRH